MKRSIGSVRGLLLASLIFAGIITPGKAEAASCFATGVPVKNNVTLTADITDCADHGIEIGKSGLTIDLNGHTIDGDDDDEDFGIYNPKFDNIKIVGPGTIKEFGTGIRIENANSNSIDGVIVTANNGDSTGIVVTRPQLKGVTEKTTIKNNTVTLNDGSGIVVHGSSTGTKITGNTVEDNGGDGVFLGGAGEFTDIDGNGVDPDNFAYKVNSATIDDNEVNGNGGTGIAIDATGKLNEDTEHDGSGGKGNSITNNNANGNGAGDSPVGHDDRGDDDQGGHGIKVAGRLSSTTIDSNEVNGNGDPGDGSCFSRNGAGILVAGEQKKITITNNTVDGNAMAGMGLFGRLSKIKVDSNPSVSGNLLNCEDDEAGIFMSGAMSGVSVANNPAVDSNGGSGIMFEGHGKVVTIENNGASNNTGGGGGGSDDTAGILVHGRALNLAIVGNTANNTTNTSSTGHGIDVRGSVRRIGDADQAVLIENNTTDDNEGHGVGVRVEASKPCPGKPDGPDADSDPDCSSKGKVSDPGKESADRDCNNDANDDPDLSFDCPDITENKASNVLITGNSADGNGTDGFFAVTDVTFSNNTATNNTDFGIEHDEDPAVRGGDAEDGPHLLEDGGGNSATANGSQCSPGLTC